MAEQAQVKSLEALESLRASLLIYQTKARRAVDLALEESSRLRQWLQADCRLHWEGQIRQISRQLERARAEALTARLSSLLDHRARHEEAVRRAERDLAHARDKLKIAQRWARDFETAVSPHLRRLENVRDHYTTQLPKAAAWLHQAQLTLEAYAALRPPAPEPAPEPAPPPPTP